MRPDSVKIAIEMISPPEKVDMAGDWYEYAHLDHFWIKGRFNAIKKKLPLNFGSGTRFLEIGCGNGLIIKQMEDQYNMVVDGCDLNLMALDKVRNIRGKLFCLNINDKPIDLLNKYDGVLLMDVIEHIDDDINFLRQSISYLKKDGLVIINVPAVQSLFSVYDTEAGHKRRYSKKLISNLFEKNNIEVICITYWGFILVPIVFFRKFLLKLVTKGNIIKNGFKPSSRLLNFIFEAGLKLEHYLIKSPPIGTSILAIGRLKN